MLGVTDTSTLRDQAAEMFSLVSLLFDFRHRHGREYQGGFGNNRGKTGVAFGHVIADVLAPVRGRDPRGGPPFDPGDPPGLRRDAAVA